MTEENFCNWIWRRNTGSAGLRSSILHQSFILLPFSNHTYIYIRSSFQYIVLPFGKLIHSMFKKYFFSFFTTHPKLFMNSENIFCANQGSLYVTAQWYPSPRNHRPQQPWNADKGHFGGTKESQCFYQTRVWWLATLVRDPLTHSLTNCCLVDFIDVTLACEDANSKLSEVVTVAEIDTEKCFGKS